MLIFTCMQIIQNTEINCVARGAWRHGMTQRQVMAGRFPGNMMPFQQPWREANTYCRGVLEKAWWCPPSDEGPGTGWRASIKTRTEWRPCVVINSWARMRTWPKWQLSGERADSQAAKWQTVGQAISGIQEWIRWNHKAISCGPTGNELAINRQSAPDIQIWVRRQGSCHVSPIQSMFEIEESWNRRTGRRVFEGLSQHRSPECEREAEEPLIFFQRTWEKNRPEGSNPSSN